MPRSEDIERFTQVLNSLGDEPAIRAARSETIEKVPAPGEEPVPTVPGGLDSIEDTGTGGESENLQDLFESLSALPEEGAPVPETDTGGAELPGDVGPEAEPAGEGLDFASLFGEQAAPEGIEELDRPAPQAGEPAEEDAFSFPGGEPQSLQADLSEMETLPEETEPGPTDFEAPRSDSAGAESFELPSLEGLSFSEPVEGAPSEPAGPSAEESSFDQPSSSFEGPLPSLEAPDQRETPAPGAEVPTAGFDQDTAAFEAVGGGAGVDQFPSERETAGPGPAEETAMGPEAGMESLGEESLGDLNLDEFSLPESAEQFGIPGAAAPELEPPPAEAGRGRPAARARPAEKAQPAEKARPAEREPRPQPPAPALAPGFADGAIELTPEQFAQVKRALESLPRNLKIAVQDLIGQGAASRTDVAALLTLLLSGATAQEIATLAGRISGKRIRIPAGYEKRSGVAFEAEQRTFAYAFRENILPLLRVVAITVLAGGLFGFLGYNYVYRPLSAYANYRAGYAQIANDRFTLANERFAWATAVWPLKRWYYSYAEAFEAKRQYLLAEQKYDQLLAAYPGDRKGTLDYARMESDRLADYEKADSLLRRFLDGHFNDFEALLATGDNDLRWGERDKAKFEAARLAYTTLMDKYGARDELLFRMLRFFIRTDNLTEVERLRAFYATRPEVKVDAPVFAELGGYLVDHRRLDYVQDVLFRADKVQPNMYEVHYNLARYYRLVRNLPDEKQALDATVKALDRTKAIDPVTLRRLTVEIDTHTRLGEYHYGSREYIPAEKELQTAIRLVETNQKMKLIDKDRLFGRPYAVLGDLYYTIAGDLQNAAIQYQKAIDNGYTDPELTYKIGYIQYAQKDYKGALDSFTNAEDASAYPSGNEALAPAAQPEPAKPPGQPPQNLLYALGNTFYQRGDYFAAQGYFLRLLDRLETRKAALGLLHPEDRPDDRALLDSLVKVNNNLGVTMFHLAQRTGDRSKKSEALVYLSAASEIAGTLARTPDTVKRSENTALPSLNMHSILYPMTGFELLVFSLLPRDFQAADW